MPRSRSVPAGIRTAPGVLITEAERRIDAVTDAARGAVTDPRQRAGTLIVLARASAASRDPVRAAGLVAEAEQAARRVDAIHRPDALAEIIPAIVALGDAERAEEIACTIDDLDLRTEATVEMVAAIGLPAWMV